MGWTAIFALTAAQIGAPPAQTPRPTAEQAPAVVIDMAAEYAGRLNAFRERQRLASNSSVAAELQGMSELDQEARRVLVEMRDAATDAKERQAVFSAVGPLLTALDQKHKARLLELIPEGGWFRISRDGADTTTAAWLLLQHSQDEALMSRVLDVMGPLVRQREVEPKHYALLFDRVAQMRGMPQRYGSQGTCRGPGTRLTIDNVDDPEAVDRRRREIGWTELFSETMARLRVGRTC